MRLCSLHKMLDAEMARSQRSFASTSLADIRDGDGGIRSLCDPTGRLPLTVAVEPEASPQI